MFLTSPANSARPSRQQGPHLWVWLVLGLLSVGITATIAVPTPMSAGDESVDNILLDFSATWCGPCQQMHPIVKRLEREGLPIRQVDVDRNPGLAQRFNVTSIPAFVLVANGREVDRVVGQVSENRLRQMVAKLPTTRGPQGEGPGDVVAELGPARPLPRIPRQPAEVEPGVAPVVPSAKIRQLPFDDSRVEPAFRGQDPGVAARAGDPLPATVRLRVRDQGGLNYGTGTILESRPGWTLVLTCGHLFRQASQGQQVGIEVDFFPVGGRVETLVGQVVGYDLDGDVGLVSVPTQQPLPASRLAGPVRPLAVGETLVSIGCSAGADPTREEVHATAINKFVGPDNIECTGVPVQGRSGGGLFRENGELVGICTHADLKGQRGIYAALNPVYALLQQHNFAHLIPRGTTESDTAPTAPAIEVADNPSAGEDFPRTAPLGSDPAGTGLAVSPAAASAGAGDVAAALSQASDAEVICIVRPKDPRLPSRVVIVNQASPKLLGYLLDDAEPTLSQSAKPAVDSRSRTTLADGR